MLTGVNIINTLIKTNSTSSVGVLLFGLFIGIVALAIMVILLNELYNKFKGNQIEDVTKFFGLSLILVLLSALSIFALEEYLTRETYKTTTYQVTIDNTVKYNEFVNTYDILEHDGNIYIVKLKLEDSIKR